MKNFFRIASYLTTFKRNVFFNIFFSLLSVVFSLFSLTMAIPFLGILFKNQEMVLHMEPFSLSFNSIKHNFYYFLSKIILDHGELYALFFIGGMVILTSLLKNGFKYLALFHMASIRNGVVRNLRNKLFDKSTKLPLSYFNKERKGDLISRMTNDVQNIENSVISSLEMLFADPITILVYLIFLLLLSPQLTLFVLIMLPLSGFIIGRVGKNLRSTALRSQNKLGVILSIIDEALTGLRVVKAFNAERKMNNRFVSTNSFYTRIMVKMFRRQYLAAPMSEFLGTAVVVIIMWYGGSLILGENSSLQSQDLIGYLVVFSQIITPAKSFSSAFYHVQKGLASADRVDEILNAPLEIIEKPNAVNFSTFSDCIQYHDVSFKYEDDYVLKNINLSIPKGSTIALVGQSGAGKSTFVDLLPRFYDVTEGKITVDGIDLRDMKFADLRELMGNVNQEAILFNDSVFNNIAFGTLNVSEEDVINAAKVANAHEFIQNLPHGYYTNIGDRGNKLSGGQKQRLSIARAILKNPPILILDEATSALDTESERLVQDALTKIMENRTSIVIAHRLSTVVNADLICVMHQGQIVETGRHQELLDMNGIYTTLHKLQMFS